MAEFPEVLATTTKFARGSLATGLASDAVDPDGGNKAAGIIRGMAVITAGEAKGHGVWIDQEFLGQVADAMNGKTLGAKSRFTHPGLSSDGTGKFLGRAFDAKVDGDQVRADLHFSRAAHETPDGDLADYVMSLAVDDPQAFGTSIVFVHDQTAEAEFKEQHTDDDGVFSSPDPLNADNLQHARLKSIRAVDVVDEPAANPAGLFHQGHEIAADAEALVAFSLGLTDERPEMAALEIDPGRVAGFVERFLQRHGLELNRKDEAMAEIQNEAGTEVAEVVGAEVAEVAEVVEDEVAEVENVDQEIPDVEATAEVMAVTSEMARQECGEFIEAFGAENGGRWFAEGMTMTQAKDLHIESLQQENAALQQQVEDGKGEPEPVGMGEDRQGSDFEKEVDRFKGMNMSRTASVLAANVRMSGNGRK